MIADVSSVLRVAILGGSLSCNGSGKEPLFKEMYDLYRSEYGARRRSRMIVPMLIPLGIEKGKPFMPNESQKKILEQGALIGEAMARNLSYAKRQKEGP